MARFCTALRTMSITPFTINVPDPVLTDLQERLARVRWPDEVGTNWTYGTDLAYLKSLIGYWPVSYTHLTLPTLY